MCVIVKVNGVECTNKIGLRNALGVEPVRNEQYKTWSYYDCLCPCDIEATAKLANMQLAGDVWDVLTMTPNDKLRGSEAVPLE